ncbi:uncharacterized protein [Diabrotica undecimpunctata]|uniref:uncharacterized protein n=1 Tax=Diabrotica undecimpunctata TaxID=50387 RepID=UPI003B63530D
MYRQVLVDPKLRSLQRILWRRDPSNPISVYELNTVTYGTASASFLAIRYLHEVAYNISEKHPLISKIILKDFYVDDLLTGGSTIEEVQHIRSILSTILNTFGFPLRKFVSNSIEIANSSTDPESFVNLGIDEPTKTLGLLWHPKNDVLMYTIRDQFSDPVTKRSILSIISQIFDPLGLLLPYTVTAKLIVQRLWQLCITWDESIPLNLTYQWQQFKDQIHLLQKLQIPRHALCISAEVIELHGFADSSESAYGAVIYVKSIDNSGTISVHLLCAKNRVAPLKILNIPRLELCAALLLAELMNKIKDSLQLHVSKIYYYSDSTIILLWIKSSPHLYKVFIANRIQIIQSLSNSQQWFHIPTKKNPADLLSRGIPALELCNSDLWWHGPEELLLPSSLWPINGTPLAPCSELPELKSIKQIF